MNKIPIFRFSLELLNRQIMKKIDAFRMLKLLSLPAMALGLLIFAGCGGDDEEEEVPTLDIVELISSTEFQQSSTVESTEALDSLVKYLTVYPDLIALLGGTTEYTVFAPSNAAFISLLATPGFPEDIADINPDIVKGVLSYHVVAGTKLAADLTSGTSVTTLFNSEAIVVNADGTLKTGATNQAIVVLNPDNKATNGVVHVTGSVLISPSVGATLTPILGTNAGTLLLGAPFTTLAAGIQLGNAFAEANDLPTLTSILAGATDHTVFAPTNETFAAGEITANTFTGQQWYGIIANHVVVGEVIGTADLTTGASFDTAAGGSLLIFNNTAVIPARNGVGIYIDGNGSVSLANPATFTTFDAEVVVPNAAETGNGVIHVIAGVLSPL